MPKRISQETENKIVSLYNNGSGTCEIGRVLGINRWTVLQYLKSNGLNPQRKTRPYKNKYNINFFKETTKDSAYWAGFIMADGNIHSKRGFLQIGLQKGDEGHLKKFAKSIGFTGPIYTDKSSDSRKIIVNGEWFAEDLKNNFCIIPRKTHTSVFPDVSKDYIRHFIRGYFDGDGSVSIGNSIVISFIGNINIINNIISVLITNINITYKCKLYKTKSENIVQFFYSADNALNILRWLYLDSDDTNRLDRKYEVYKQCLLRKGMIG